MTFFLPARDMRDFFRKILKAGKMFMICGDGLHRSRAYAVFPCVPFSFFLRAVYAQYTRSLRTVYAQLRTFAYSVRNLSVSHADTDWKISCRVARVKAWRGRGYGNGVRIAVVVGCSRNGDIFFCAMKSEKNRVYSVKGVFFANMPFVCAYSVVPLQP